MEFTVHNQVLLLAFAVAAVMGAVANKTNFCTMGAVSDLVNIGDTGRMRSWIFALTVAMIGVLILEATRTVSITATNTFPPYRTANFAWLRYVLGGIMFGIGMTLGSGCGNKTFVRIGGGNLKSLVLLAFFAAPAAYLMLWGSIGEDGFYEVVFARWIESVNIPLASFGIQSQEIGAIIGGLAGMEDTRTLHLVLGGVIAVLLLWFVFKSADFRGSFDAVLGGAVIGLAVVAGWWLTGGAMGQEWKEFAEFQTDVPSRVAVQSYTFISPMGDTVRWLTQPSKLFLVNFGVMALTGVIAGSFLYALVTRKFRFEWFANFKDFVAHAFGGMLMGFGGVLSMGCTIGQGVTGVSTLALGSILTFAAIVFGASLTMKVQYHMLDEKNFIQALRHGLAELKLLPTPRPA